MNPLTGEDLKEFTTALLDGDEMDDTPFYIMANMAKTIIESRRPWRRLMTKSSNLTASPSDTYLTTKALPTRWIMFDQYKPMTLISASGSVKTGYKACPFSEREENINNGPLFYIDVKNETFGLIHDINTTYTIHLNYTEESPEITSATSWAFPARFHPLIAYFVSAMQKGGVDYDDIFARMAPENRSQAEALAFAMEMWDDQIQRQELNV